MCVYLPHVFNFLKLFDDIHLNILIIILIFNLWCLSYQVIKKNLIYFMNLYNLVYYPFLYFPTGIK